MKTLKLLFASLVRIIAISAESLAQPKPWVVPANFSTMKNPVARGAASTKTGMASLYEELCILSWKSRSR